MATNAIFVFRAQLKGISLFGVDRSEYNVRIYSCAQQIFIYVHRKSESESLCVWYLQLDFDIHRFSLRKIFANSLVLKFFADALRTSWRLVPSCYHSIRLSVSRFYSHSLLLSLSLSIPLIHFTRTIKYIKYMWVCERGLYWDRLSSYQFSSRLKKLFGSFVAGRRLSFVLGLVAFSIFWGSRYVLLSPHTSTLSSLSSRWADYRFLPNHGSVNGSLNPKPIIRSTELSSHKRERERKNRVNEFFLSRFSLSSIVYDHQHRLWAKKSQVLHTFDVILEPMRKLGNTFISDFFHSQKKLLSSAL